MTLGHWNPLTPDRVGLEYQADLDAGAYGSVATSYLTGFRQTYRSENTGTVTGAVVARSIASDPPVIFGGLVTSYNTWIWEMFADGNEVPSFGAWTSVAVNAAPVTVGTITPWAAASVLDAVDTESDDTEFLIIGAASLGTTSSVQFQFGSGAASIGASKRIQLRVNIRERVAGAGEILSVALVDNATGEAVTFSKLIYGSGTFTTSSVYLPEINPFTEKYWTEADVQKFDADYRIRLSVPSGLSRSVVTFIELDYRVANENRVAFGIVKETAKASNTLAAFAVSQPDSGSAWSKAATTTYSWHARRPWLGSLAGLSYLAVSVTEAWTPVDPTITYLRGPTNPGWTGYDVSTTLFNPQGYDITDADYSSGGLGVFPAGTMARCVLTTAGADEDDGQPYCLVRAEPVSASFLLEQEFSAPSSATFDGIVATIRYDTSAIPTADLTVAVRRMSDNQLRGTADISTATYLASNQVGASKWRTVQVQLTSTGALTSGTDYSIEFTSATVDTAPWYVQVLDTVPDGTSSGHSLSTFSGDEAATIDGVLRTEADVATWIFDGPAPPTSFAAVASSTPLAWYADTLGADRMLPILDGCIPDSLPYQALTWTKTALGGSFVQYEIERLAAVNGEIIWQTIALIPDETVESFDDYEVNLGRQAVYYRIRTWSTVGGGSWSAVFVLTPTVEADCLWLTSNHDRSQAYAVIPLRGSGDAITYSYAEADQAVTMPIFGRDTPVAFRPVERSGTSFEVPVLVDVMGENRLTVPPGPAAYANVVDMTTDPDLPYVCVRDRRGNVWRALVTVPNVAPQIIDNRVTLLVATMRVTAVSAVADAATS